jgi:hypothetical protein
MTGQLITPAAAVFPGLAAAAATGARGGAALELGFGSVSNGTGSRGVTAAVEAPNTNTNTTLFSFKPKPKSGSNKPLYNIQFLV